MAVYTPNAGTVEFMGKPTKEEISLEGQFWTLIRTELLNMAEDECSDYFFELVESKVKSMGPEALKRLYIKVNGVN